MDIQEGDYSRCILGVYLGHCQWLHLNHNMQFTLTGVTNLRTFVTYSSVDGQCNRNFVATKNPPRV